MRLFLILPGQLLHPGVAPFFERADRQRVLIERPQERPVADQEAYHAMVETAAHERASRVASPRPPGVHSQDRLIALQLLHRVHEASRAARAAADRSLQLTGFFQLLN